MTAGQTTPLDRAGVAPRLTPLAASTGALLRRMIIRMLRMPTVVMPTVVMPAFFMLAFAGSFGSIASVEGFPTDNFVSWVAPFALLQSASFAGVGASSAMAIDLENGFVDRLLLSPIHRLAVLFGALGQAAIRSLIPVTIVLVMAPIQGAGMPAGVAGVAMAFVGGIGIALMLGSIGLAVVCRLGDTRALTLVQVVGFILMFPSNGQVPVDMIDGWLHHVARFNPATLVIRMTRQGFIGDITWAETWPGLLVIALTVTLFVRLAISELQRRAIDG